MSEHVCPVWIGYLLASPIRKLFHNPQKILGPIVQPGMTVLDVGSAMGFFSIPAAEMVGSEGRVICADCQPRMLEKLTQRARTAGVESQIETHACSTSSLGLEELEGQVDVARAVAMVHEAPDPERLLTEIFNTLKPGGLLLVAEPKGHVTDAQIKETLQITESLGLQIIERPSVRRTFSFVMQRAA